LESNAVPLTRRCLDPPNRSPHAPTANAA
jgi:hypothetical protein